MASALPLVSYSSAPIELLFFVHYPSVNMQEPKSATISIVSITSDVQPLPPSLVGSSARAIVHYLPSFPDLNHCEWPAGWERRLGETYQLGTVALPVITVPTDQSRFWDAYGNKIIVSINH